MARTRFVSPDVVRLPLSDGYWIDVKKELNAGEERRIFTNIVKTMHAGEKAELDPDKVGKTQMLAYIVDWNFTGEDGKTVPFSEAALDNLDQPSYAEISAAIDTHVEGVEKARAERKNGQSTSPVSSVTSA